MRKTILRNVCRVIYIAAISVIIAIGCGDNGVQDKSQRVGEFINMFVDVGTPPADVQYTLTVNVFPPEGGTVLRNPDTDSYKAGTSVSLTAKSDNGYTFLGWSGAINSANPEITVTMNGDKTLTASFNDGRPTYDVYFNSNDAAGGAPLPVRTISGNAITLPDQGSMERPGYSFAGWTKDKSGTGTLYDPNSSYTVTEGVTLYAKWTLTTYTITYALNDGTATANLTSYTIETATFKLHNPTKTGYTFAGWTEANDMTMMDTAVTVAKGSTGNKSYTAKWLVVTYTITYILDGGTVAIANPTSYTVETATFILNNPTKTGYIFAGWTGANGATPQTTVSVANGSTGNKSYTANWTTSGGGDSYESVVIGGKTWMKKNLNIETANSWCYGNSTDSCAKYGRLYTWEAATKACPTGWKLPFRQDWQNLVDSAGGYYNAGKALKAKNGWNDYNGNSGNGTDSYGFSALPGGGRGTNGYFNDAGGSGYWWTATEYSSGNAYFRSMRYFYDYVDEYYDVKGLGHSVRCVHD